MSCCFKQASKNKVDIDSDDNSRDLDVNEIAAKPVKGANKVNMCYFTKY